MAGLLAEFLRWSAGAPTTWGEVDCYWWSMRWLVKRLGRDDFVAGLREKYCGRYRTARGCARLVRRLGGIVVVAGELARAAGLREVAVPALGDLVVVRRDDGELVIGVAVAPTRAALKRWPRGVSVVSRPVVAAWGL